MITFKHKGDFSKTNKMFERMLEIGKMSTFDKYGKLGVEALKSATPKDTGKTSDSWDYEISHGRDYTTIAWTNSNINEGCPIAIVLQYGHATGWGTYVKGEDYINPAMKPVFDKIAKDAWEEVIAT